ncbi:MAG: hypothetical protein JWR12_1059 [Mucilaginibacter sp.]|nr:hypothetical protein [Mucilaginibacter sp.]
MMKIGKTPLISIALLFVCLLQFALKRVMGAAQLAYYSPFFDGVLAGVVFAYVLYNANVYITARRNNRREHVSN